MSKTSMPFPTGAGSAQPIPQGGAVPRVTVPQPSRAASTRQAPIPRVAAAPSPRDHISPEVRGALGGLNPELAVQIRRVAKTK